jgi:glycosyltransferase involved in cell wall biosynthesis
MPVADISSDPLKVWMLAPTRERCGIGDYTRLLVNGLRELPEIEEVTLVSTPEGAVRSSTISALKHYLSDEQTFHALGHRLNGGDVVHIQHQYFFYGGVAPHKNHFAALLNAVRIPVVMTVHEVADGGATGWKRALIAFTNRRNFRHPVIRHIIVHTQADLEKLCSMGIDKARMTVIPVGVPPVGPLPNREAAQTALGIGGKRVLLMFGFLSTKKGHRVALEALKGLPDDCVLVFAGERHPDDPSDYVGRLKESIAAYGLERRVLITGYLPEDRIPDVMAAADVALAPFIQSSGSASLAHLLASGLPVVASDIPPHRELLAQSPGSLALFPDGNAAALREQIVALLHDAVLRNSLSAGAGRFCMDRSYAQVARRTMDVYRKAIRD